MGRHYSVYHHDLFITHTPMNAYSFPEIKQNLGKDTTKIKHLSYFVHLLPLFKIAQICNLVYTPAMAWNLYLEKIAGTSSSLSEAYNQVMVHSPLSVSCPGEPHCCCCYSPGGSPRYLHRVAWWLWPAEHRSGCGAGNSEGGSSRRGCRWSSADCTARSWPGTHMFLRLNQAISVETTVSHWVPQESKGLQLFMYLASWLSPFTLDRKRFLKQERLSDLENLN